MNIVFNTVVFLCCFFNAVFTVKVVTGKNSKKKWLKKSNKKKMLLLNAILPVQLIFIH